MVLSLPLIARRSICPILAACCLRLISDAAGGDGFTWFGVAPLLAYFYAGAGDEGYRVLVSFESTQLLCSLALDLAAIVFMKTLFKRPRPPHHKTDFRFMGPDVHSFPSGHATRCWSVLGTLAFLSSRSTAEASSAALVVETVAITREHAVMLTGWGLLMCFGRVALGRHYVTDVVAGGVIGRYLITPLSVNLHASLLALYR